MQNYREDFERDGFCVVRGMFTAQDAAIFKAEILRLLEQHKSHAGVFVGLAANSPIFREAAKDTRLLDVLESILGPDIEFLSDKVAFKSGSVEYPSPWHQDYPYWRGAHKLSVWIALDPATKENGCLKLLPGSHRAEAAHEGVARAGEGFPHRLKPGEVDESLAFVAECEPGDAVVFHDLTLHSSFPNRSGEDRVALISTYRGANEPDRQYDWSVAAEVVRGTKRSAVTPAE